MNRNADSPAALTPATAGRPPRAPGDPSHGVAPVAPAPAEKPAKAAPAPAADKE